MASASRLRRGRSGRSCVGTGSSRRAACGAELAAVPARASVRAHRLRLPDRRYRLASALVRALLHRTRHPTRALGGVTANPHERWVTQQARNLVVTLAEREQPVRYLIRDRDSKFTRSFDEVFRTEGIRVIRTPVRAPRGKAHPERWVGSLRRECLDRLLIVGRPPAGSDRARLHQPSQRAPSAPLARATPAAREAATSRAAAAEPDRSPRPARRTAPRVLRDRRVNGRPAVTEPATTSRVAFDDRAHAAFAAQQALPFSASERVQRATRARRGYSPCQIRRNLVLARARETRDGRVDPERRVTEFSAPTGNARSSSSLG